MIVVDASAIADLVLDPATHERSPLLRDVAIHAPSLIDFELASVLRGWLLSGQISEPGTAAAIGQWSRLNVVRHPFDGLIGPVLDLRHNLTAYDAAYVVLARALKAPLVTADARLAAAATNVQVVLI